MKTFSRWVPTSVALLTAPLVWLAFPGGGKLWPLLSLALLPLLFSVKTLSGRGALLAGWLTGMVQYLLLLYWIVIVLGKYGGLPTLVTVPALLLLSTYMGLYLGIFTFLARAMLHHCSPLISLLGLPGLWVGLDWLRGQLFTGLPWMDLGYGLGNVPRLIQIADLFGHHGITFIIVLINTSILLLLTLKKSSRKLPIICISVTILVSVACYSEFRWRDFSTRLAAGDAERITVGVIQGNIDQSEKWSPHNQQDTVDTYLEKSRGLFTDSRVDLIVWPETALPFYPATYPEMDRLYAFANQYDVALITGSPWFEVIDLSSREVRYYNSAQLLEPASGFTDSYYKSHLVPFGEYIPMKRFLPFLAPLVETVGDFTPGKIESPLSWSKAEMGVMICFESIFPDISRKWVMAGANVLVNLTNDAWYGKSSAPYQSIVMSVLRAVESRRSVVRAANTGVSGFIDPLGRIEHPSEIFTLWAKAEDVAIFTEKSPYVRWGYGFAPSCLMVGLILALWALSQKKRRGRLTD